jgi:hypothetical protein
MNATTTKTSLIDWFDEHMNPMAVRYFRQAVQNKTLMIMVILLLALQVGVAVIMVMQNTSFYAGQYLFVGIAICWTLMTCLIVPAYISQRVAADRGDKLDLTSITTMSPFRYINGIFFMGVTILVLMSSVCLPFMTFCYILRGIGFVEIFGTIYGVLSGGLLMLMLGIMCGAYPTRNGKSSGGILLVLLFIISIGPLYGMVSTMLLFGGPSVSWVTVGISGTAGLLLQVGLFYLIAVFKVSPPMSNRMLSLRIYVLFMLAAIAGLSFFLDGFSLDAVESNCVYTAFVIICSMLVAVSEQDAISLRVRTQIPRSKLTRIIAWFFYSGSAAGICWCVAAYAGMLLTLYLADMFFTGSHSSDFNQDFSTLLTIGLYAYCFCMTAVFVRKAVLRDALSPSKTILLLVCLLLMIHIITHTLAVMVVSTSDAWSFWSVFDGLSLRWWMTFNPAVYVVTENKTLFTSTAVPVLSIWAGAITLVMLPWFKVQLQNFTPIKREEIAVFEK